MVVVNKTCAWSGAWHPSSSWQEAVWAQHRGHGINTSFPSSCLAAMESTFQLPGRSRAATVVAVWWVLISIIVLIKRTMVTSNVLCYFGYHFQGHSLEFSPLSLPTILRAFCTKALPDANTEVSVLCRELGLIYQISIRQKLFFQNQWIFYKKKSLPITTPNKLSTDF